MSLLNWIFFGFALYALVGFIIVCKATAGCSILIRIILVICCALWWPFIALLKVVSKESLLNEAHRQNEKERSV